MIKKYIHTIKKNMPYILILIGFGLLFSGIAGFKGLGILGFGILAVIGLGRMKFKTSKHLKYYTKELPMNTKIQNYEKCQRREKN
jgi:hypothetical protein